MRGLGSYENERYDFGSYIIYHTTNHYTTIYAASNFRGNFTAQNNSWVYEDANHLQFNVKDNSGANCVLKITTSGNEKKVYVGKDSDSKLEYLGKDSYNYYKYKETTDYYNRYLMVPEVINITLTRNDAIVISAKLTTDLSSMNGEEFNINTDKYNANIAFTIGQHTISVDKAKYSPNANSEIKFQIQKGYKSLLDISLSTNPIVANDELQDATNTNISINILGKIQIKGTCANISQYLSCLENADNNDWNSTQFKAYIAEANNLLEFGLYNNNQRFAKAKLLCFGGDQWYYTPAIIFEDGTSYSFEQFFNEESFREIIEVVEAMMREYEVMLAN